MKRVQRSKTGPTVLDREQGFETFVHIAEYRRTGAEIRRDWQHAVWGLGQKSLARLYVSSDISAAKAIDRLLRIAHQKQRAGPNAEGRPIGAFQPGRRFSTKPPKDFRLKRIGILKFVD